MRFLKIQRRLFRESFRELTRREYDRLTQTARALGKERLSLLMETICATGIRVSEVRYITVEAARAGRAEISLKGKIRTILLPGKLRRKLLQYAGNEKNRLRRDISHQKRKQPVPETDLGGDEAPVQTRRSGPPKVFPHNLRHLFAAVFYRGCRDIVKLADVLGHSSIETTRLYLLTTGAEHARQLDRLGLIC